VCGLVKCVNVWFVWGALRVGPHTKVSPHTLSLLPMCVVQGDVRVCGVLCVCAMLLVCAVQRCVVMWVVLWGVCSAVCVGGSGWCCSRVQCCSFEWCCSCVQYCSCEWCCSCVKCCSSV